MVVTVRWVVNGRDMGAFWSSHVLFLELVSEDIGVFIL